MKNFNYSLILKLLFTLGCFNFFGPVFRDGNESHLMNPEWVSHARYHFLWNIFIWAGMGLYSIYLLWISDTDLFERLKTCLIFEAINLSSFWLSYFFAELFGANALDKKIHVYILGIPDNLFVFSVLSLLFIINLFLLISGSKTLKENS
ncbi:MAG: hypothetical protein SFU98_09050 [Leptospiraceae bacterium]|nr:hypothetical protein [Leptospiraceae bacterium]